MDPRYGDVNEISVAHWNDNSVVTSKRATLLSRHIDPNVIG